jgi:hypothetical protein
VTDTTESESRAHRLPRWRRALVAILVVLSVVLLPVAGLTVWVRNLVLDTGKYVDTVAPLASNKDVTDTVANRITTRLFSQVNVEQQAKDALPERAQFLASPIATGVETFTREAATRALASDQFKTLWRNANERAHKAVNKVLTGEGKNVSVKNGKIVLDLTPVVNTVIQRLDDRGVTVFDSVLQDVSKKNLQVELFDASQLEKARSAVHLLDRLRIVLVVLVFVLLGIALALSGARRRTLMRWGIGVVVAMAITAGLLALGRSAFLGAAKNRDTAAAVFDILTSLLRNGIRTIAVLGLVVAVAAFLSGPSRLAVRTRDSARRLIGGIGRADQPGWEPGPVGRWVAAHKVALRAAGVALAVLVLLVWSNPRPLTILVLALLLLVYLAVIEFLGRAPADVETHADSRSP